MSGPPRGELAGQGQRPNEVEGFEPLRVCLVDLAEEIPEVSATPQSGGGTYARAATYVTWSGSPLGVVWTDIPAGGVSAASMADAIWSQLAEPIRQQAETHGVVPSRSLDPAGLGSLPLPERPGVASHISVIVATRDRPALLDRCLESILALQYASFDVIVVDNAPSTEATMRLVAERYGDEPSVRYVREDRQGLAAAHNRGLEEASGAVVAFTDDDVVVERSWLTNIASAFTRSDEVACVTGMIVPLQLDTQAQWWLEGYAGFSKGFERREFNLAEHRPDDVLFPYTAGKLGSGANMAFRRDVLREMGGFDAALGAGSGAYGGDDLAAFFEVVVRGHTLVYEPGAIVHHQHPATERALRRQVFGYGAGLTAYLTRTVIERPRSIFTLLAKSPRAAWYALAGSSGRNERRPTDFPFDLCLRELAGMAIGPPAYLRVRLRARREARPAQ